MTRIEPPVVSTPSEARRSAGFRLIIGYKFVKAGLMLGVALWLTIAPGAAFRTLNLLARDLAEGGAAFARLGHWLQTHLSTGVVVRGALLAWLDSVSSAVEAILLLSGKPWAQWVVIVGLALLIPFEILSIEHRPGIGKVVVLAVNAAIVAYLAWGQMRRAQA